MRHKNVSNVTMEWIGQEIHETVGLQKVRMKDEEIVKYDEWLSLQYAINVDMQLEKNL